MIIHSEDKTEVEMRVTDEGEMFLFCPECKSIWETKLTAIKKRRETRPINYGGARIDLDAVEPVRVKERKTTQELAALAKELFPEALK